MPVTWLPKVDWLSQEGKLREQLDAEWAKINNELRKRNTLQLPSRPSTLPLEIEPLAPELPSVSRIPAWASITREMPTARPRFPTPTEQFQEERPLPFLETTPIKRLTPQRRTVLEQPPIVPEVEAPKEVEKKEPVAFWKRALQVFAK